MRRILTRSKILGSIPQNAARAEAALVPFPETSIAMAGLDNSRADSAEPVMMFPLTATGDSSTPERSKAQPAMAASQREEETTWCL